MSAVLVGAWNWEAIQLGLLASSLLSCVYFFLSNLVYEGNLPLGV
jgi:hypothetical protein